MILELVSEEGARTIYLLASDDSDFLTGKDLEGTGERISGDRAHEQIVETVGEGQIVVSVARQTFT